MYCHPCQKSFSEDDLYCSRCGQKLSQTAVYSGTQMEQTIAIFPDTEHNQAIIKSKQQVKHKTLFNFVFRSVVIMLVIFVFITAFLIWTYSKQAKINEAVLAMQSEAKSFALAGNYEGALVKLDEAVELRPQFQALKEDRNIIHEAIRLQRMAVDVEQSLEKGIEIESERKLDLFRQELNGLKEPIFAKQREQLETLNMKFTILSLSNDLTQLYTIDELGNLLNIANGLVGEDATVLRNQIKDRIRTTTTAEVNELIKGRRYSAAISTINQSLTWLRNDKQLIDLKTNIEQQRNEFDQIEQERIRKAMEEQAAEDYINQTAAIELISFSKRLDELGQGVIIVSLKNVATRAIYDVNLEYGLLNANGEPLYANQTGVMPNYILSGETMIYSFTLPHHIDIAMVHQVNINKGTWSLD